MANANSPYGIIPVAYTSGAPYNGAVRTYYVPVGNGTAMYFGDPIMLVTNGTGSDANGVPAVRVATAGATNGTYNRLLGAYMGRSNNAGQLTIPVLQNSTPYLPASTAAYIYVSDDPNLLYKAQEDSDGGAIAYTAGGGNVNLIAGSGSAYTSYSGWMLDSSVATHTSNANTQAYQMRIIQALQEADNAIGTYCKWLVRINYGLSPFTTGAPV